MKDIQYRQILETAPFGYAYHKILTDDSGKPVDYRFLEANAAFENLTGLKATDIVGRTVLEVLSGTGSAEFDWIAFYGNIALNGGSATFEQYSKVLERWYKVQVHAPRKYYFTTVFVDITGEKAKSSELEVFFSVNLDLLCIADTDGNFIKVNAEWENVLGYSVNELQHRKFLDFVHPDDLQATLDTLTTLDSQEEVLNFVNRYRCKDGSWRYIEWRSRPVGNLVYAAARDITKSKAIEQELQDSQARFKLAIDGSRDGIWDWDLKADSLFLSKRWKQMLGYEDDELRNSTDTFNSLIHEDDAGWLDESIQKYLHGDLTKYAFEFRMRHKDGSIRWVLSKGEAVRDEHGTPYRMAGSHSDITDRKLVEASLAESAQKFSKLFNNNPALMAVSTLAERRITEVNQTFLAKTGYSNEECIGRTTDELKLFTNRSQQDQLLDELRHTGRVQSRELQITARTGEVLDGLFSGEIIESQGTRYVLMVMADITEQKRAEQRALAASKAKSDFLAIMSHEIRTPMNGIIGMTGLLLDTALTDEQQQYARIVRTSGDALLALINDILDFSKIEAGKLDLDALDFNLRVTIEDTVDILSMKAREKGIKLESILDPDVPVHLKGDPGRLRQILINLAGNAVKFTGAGGVAIRTRLVSENETTACLRFSIIDSGIGIPKDKQAALFSPFTQVDSSTTRKYGGTGLGLAISKQLAEAMGGTIGLESEPGTGSTFWFTAFFDKRTAGELTAAPAFVNLLGLRVLVVDSQETNRLLATSLLATWGCRFSEAADGDSAVLLLEAAAREAAPFDIALLDMEIPGMDGTELGRRIKDNPALRDTRLIMMTSIGKRGDAAVLAGLGFSGYLTKPIRQSQFHECLSLVAGRDHHDVKPAVEDTAATPAITDGRKDTLRILLAEDNQTNQLVAIKILEKLGYRVDAVANGNLALEAMRKVPYDLVLMDCQMPELDGYEATRELRSREAGGKRTPVIAMTANALQGDRDRCLEAGMDDYLSKPVEPAKLSAMLDFWLRGSDPDFAELEAVEEGSAPQPATFDYESFKARTMFDDDMARTLIGMFLTDLPLQLEAMVSAVAARDSKAAERQAHRIKGSSANMSGDALSNTAAALEVAGRNGDIAALDRLLPELHQRVEALRSAMEAMISMSLS